MSGLPLAVARAVATEFSRLQPATGTTMPPVEVTISTALDRRLESMNAKRSFRIEITEVLAAIAGTSVELKVVTDTELRADEVRVRQKQADTGVASSLIGEMPGTDAPEPTTGSTLALEVDGNRTALHGAITLGRSSSCDLTIADTEISRQHAQISMSLEGALLADLGSTNGTFVNGIRLTSPRRIVEGDSITIGATDIRVVRT